MQEEIIIDEIDVSGCSLLNKKTKVCMYSRETCNGICDYGSYARNEIIDRLKQENEILKEKLEIANNSDKRTLEILHENEELKKEINKLGKKHEDYCNTMYWQMKEQIDNYRSALEEIKTLCNKGAGIYTNAKVVGLINEVLNEQDN